MTGVSITSGGMADAVALRRLIHAEPRVSGEEGPTAETVRKALPPDVPVEPVADTGLVARIGGPGPAIGIRAELDALAVTERTGVPWAATSGAMHACGHDIHMAAAVALARAVHETPGATPLVLVLQPREESPPSGAADVVASGVLAEHEVAAMVGTHVQPLLPEGTVACTPGAVNASSDEFTVVMRGRGGHAAYPQLAADPVLALSQFVVAVQQLVSRNVDPMVPAVVSVSTLAAGRTANVLPDDAVAEGTVRAMTEDHRKLLQQRLGEIAHGVASAHGCAAEVTIRDGEPVLVNDEVLAAGTAAELRALGHTVEPALRSCGADDFSHYGAELPSLMTFVGVDTGAAGLHQATFLPGDVSVTHVANALLAGYRAACGRMIMRT